MVNSSEAHDRTVKWIGEFVVGLGICPFAKHPFEQQKIEIQVFDGTDLETCFVILSDMLSNMDRVSSTEIETSLLVIPNFLSQFDNYLNAFSFAEELLLSLKLEGIIQLASFHPKYQFAHTQPHDISNYTNRSPYPMIHLLREDSVYLATEGHPDPVGIPQRNIQLLESMDSKEVKGYSK